MDVYWLLEDICGDMSRNQLIPRIFFAVTSLSMRLIELVYFTICRGDTKRQIHSKQLLILLLFSQVYAKIKILPNTGGDYYNSVIFPVVCLFFGLAWSGYQPRSLDSIASEMKPELIGDLTKLFVISKILRVIYGFFVTYSPPSREWSSNLASIDILSSCAKIFVLLYLFPYTYGFISPPHRAIFNLISITSLVLQLWHDTGQSTFDNAQYTTAALSLVCVGGASFYYYPISSFL